MPNASTNTTLHSALVALRARCMSVGLPTWRVSSAGLLTDRPDMPGVAGEWLRGRVMSEQVATGASAWLASRDDAVIELFPGCWLIALPDEPTNRRSAATLALALGADALDGPIFNEASNDADMDPERARNGLRDLASHSARSAQQARELLMLMLADLSNLGESAATLDGLTSQLTDSYETIDALYSIGRSMSDLSKPAAFVDTVCSRLKATLNFEFICARFNGDPALVAGLRDQLITVGKTMMSEDELRRSTDAVLARLPADRKFTILEDAPGLVWPRYPQALAQTLTRDGKVVGAIFAGHKVGPDPLVSSYDTQLLDAAGGYLNAFLANSALLVEQQNLFMGTLLALTSSIDAKDRYTRGHSERVAMLSSRIARVMGLSIEEAERVRIAGLVHDVGKIGVPEAVLCKQGKLTDEEYAAIKLHPEIGYRILHDIDAMADILPGVLHHHERFDGRGYPHGIKGMEIHLYARIIALADTFDAMSSNRSYRSALPREKVLEEIQRCSGSQFDPAVVRAFQKLELGHYDELVAQHADLERKAA